ncbi:hypothetical protein C8R47DRAFT_1083575 [Mycena vitilis]|nr:hypothetical protein C8R47DRAFT_1083575 [Mycena vitilis]
MWLCVICHVAVSYLPCGCVLSAMWLLNFPSAQPRIGGGLSVAVRIGGTELPISTATDRGGLSVAVLSVAVRIGGTELPISTATDRGGLSVAVLSVAVRIGGNNRTIAAASEVAAASYIAGTSIYGNSSRHSHVLTLKTSGHTDRTIAAASEVAAASCIAGCPNTRVEALKSRKFSRRENGSGRPFRRWALDPGPAIRNIAGYGNDARGRPTHEVANQPCEVTWQLPLRKHSGGCSRPWGCQIDSPSLPAVPRYQVPRPQPSRIWKRCPRSPHARSSKSTVRGNLAVAFEKTLGGMLPTLGMSNRFAIIARGAAVPSPPPATKPDMETMPAVAPRTKWTLEYGRGG